MNFVQWKVLPKNLTVNYDIVIHIFLLIYIIIFLLLSGEKWLEAKYTSSPKILPEAYIICRILYPDILLQSGAIVFIRHRNEQELFSKTLEQAFLQFSGMEDFDLPIHNLWYSEKWKDKKQVKISLTLLLLYINCHIFFASRKLGASEGTINQEIQRYQQLESVAVNDIRRDVRKKLRRSSMRVSGRSQRISLGCFYFLLYETWWWDFVALFLAPLLVIMPPALCISRLLGTRHCLKALYV